MLIGTAKSGWLSCVTPVLISSFLRLEQGKEGVTWSGLWAVQTWQVQLGLDPLTDNPLPSLPWAAERRRVSRSASSKSNKKIVSAKCMVRSRCMDSVKYMVDEEREMEMFFNFLMSISMRWKRKIYKMTWLNTLEMPNGVGMKPPLTAFLVRVPLPLQWQHSYLMKFLTYNGIAHSKDLHMLQDTLPSCNMCQSLEWACLQVEELPSNWRIAFKLKNCLQEWACIQLAFKNELAFNLPSRMSLHSTCLQEWACIQLAFKKELAFNLPSRMSLHSTCLQVEGKAPWLGC